MFTRTAALAVIVLFSGVAAQAGEVILCSRLAPNWLEFSPGKFSAANVRTTLIVDVDAKTASWASSWSNVQLLGVNSANGVRVVKVQSSGPIQHERITNISTNVRFFETNPPTYGKSLKVTMEEPSGTTGTANIELRGKKLGAIFSGDGNWSNTNSDKEDFAFCTTDVE